MAEHPEIVDTIRLLLRRREPLAEGEDGLKLFQFLWWLSKSGPTAYSYNQAGLVYASLKLAEAVHKRASFGNSNALILACADPGTQYLINAITWPKEGFHRLLDFDRPLLNAEDHRQHEGEWAPLIRFVEAKLRLERAGANDSDNNAFRLMEIEPKRKGQVQTKSRLNKAKRSRQQRLPFLYAAREKCPWMLQDRLGLATGTKRVPAGTLLRFIGDKANEREELETFFAYAKSTVRDTDETLAAETRKAWEDLTPAVIDVAPLTEDEKTLVEARRRPATETKKARRQPPSK